MCSMWMGSSNGVCAVSPEDRKTGSRKDEHLVSILEYQIIFFRTFGLSDFRTKIYSMTRVAFKMTLYKGFEEEYLKRHEVIWPELQELLKQTGISGYSIFWMTARIVYLGCSP
ncbi:L-rhamnose mutarotase [Paraflavitalea speifideaquila]|uniref:L-rhamnose mutarotase n=1 Tax=Paraflavitalea speifideaquila TaxID=3076558 RepID=UPI0028EF947C|nr:L-rhamnose mutarotase [Paraflavitalea speifideiaquila]